jgi:hypothetical protein
VSLSWYTPSMLMIKGLCIDHANGLLSSRTSQGMSFPMRSSKGYYKLNYSSALSTLTRSTSPKNPKRLSSNGSASGSRHCERKHLARKDPRELTRKLHYPLSNPPPPHSRHHGRNRARKSGTLSLHPTMAKLGRNLEKCGTGMAED